MQRFVVAFSNWSIRTKLMVLFLAFSMILVTGVGVLSYHSASVIIDKQSENYSEAILRQIQERVDEMRDEILKVSIPITINPSVQSNDLDNVDMSDLMNQQDDIDSKILLTKFMKKFIGSIYICNDNGDVISSERVTARVRDTCKQSPLYQSALDNGLAPRWVGVHEDEFSVNRGSQVFSFVRTLYDKENFKPLGALIINIPAAVLDDIGGRSGNNLLILDKNGNLVYRLTRAGDDSDGIERRYFDQIVDASEPAGTFNYTSGNSAYKILYTASENSDWTYVAEIPVNFLSQNSDQVKRFIAIILAIAVLMSVAAAYLMSAYFTNPILRVIRTMRQVQKGDFDIRLNVSGYSEIGQLATSYLLMVDELKKRMEEIERESREKREAELNALQAQITPHFLYNTLNSIKAMARLQKAGGIEEMTGALIDLLRLSISKKSVFVTIAEELDLVEKYVLLKNYRSGNHCTVEYECDDGVSNHMTLKLSLQPIVENCIIHGFGVRNGSGHIHIRIFRINSAIHFVVTDNGVGMDHSQLERLGRDSDRQGLSGIGIRNVQERIAMNFGNEYGLTFESSLGHYTRATIVIPAIPYEGGKLRA